MVRNVMDASIFAVGLVFGTASSILSKELYGMTVDGKAFEKPLWQTMLMFLGMFLALPVHFAHKYVVARRQRGRVAAESSASEADYQLLDAEGQMRAGGEMVDADDEFAGHQDDASDALTLRSTMLLFIPSMFDLVATALANVGLVLIEVSVYQLLKCSVIVFVAIFKRVLLRNRIEGYMWAGVVINMVAVSLAASTSFLPVNGDDASGGDAGAGGDEDADSSNAALGVLLIVLSTALQALQYCFEEKVMDGSGVSFPPLVVVGMEGFWGLLLSVAVILPLASVIPGNDCPSDGGKCVYEDSFDTMRMMSESGTITAFLVVYVFVITGYNSAAIGITYLLDAIWHSILDNFRPISVWLAQLVIFQLTGGASGEKWVVTSWIQLAGLVLLLFGTAIYNGNLRLPGFAYKAEALPIEPMPFDVASSPFAVARSVDARVRRQSSAGADISLM